MQQIQILHVSVLKPHFRQRGSFAPGQIRQGRRPIHNTPFTCPCWLTETAAEHIILIDPKPLNFPKCDNNSFRGDPSEHTPALHLANSNGKLTVYERMRSLSLMSAVVRADACQLSSVHTWGNQWLGTKTSCMPGKLRKSQSDKSGNFVLCEIFLATFWIETT